MKIIDETRLFKKIPNFFERPANVLIELPQNGQRAGATKLDISLDDNVLTVSDNGRGADSAVPLFVLAASDWSDESVELADPAGWGLYYLLCMSTEVYYKRAEEECADKNWANLFNCSRVKHISQVKPCFSPSLMNGFISERVFITQ